jgi:cell division protein ZapB
MSENTPHAAAEQEIRQLEKRLMELISALERARDENRSLKARQESLSAERAALVQKNEQVRARVEAMIGRLKSMEHGP